MTSSGMMTSEPRVLAGTFELSGISGVSLARGGDALGIRLVFLEDAFGLFDGKDLPLSMCAAPLQAPDLSYCRYEWQVPVTTAGIRRYAGHPRRQVNAPTVVHYAPGEAARVCLEWRQIGQTVVGRYTSDLSARFILIVNGCFQPGKVLQAGLSRCVLEMGKSRLHLLLEGRCETPLLLDHYRDLERAWVGLSYAGGQTFVAYPVKLGEGDCLQFVMTLEESEPLTIPKTSWEDARRNCEQNQMRSTGALAGLDGAAEAVASMSAYCRAYDPSRGCLQATVNRTWSGVNRPGLIFGWDNFFMAYSAAWSDPGFAAEALKHIVSVYTGRGVEHGPTQRNLIIPTLYCRTLALIGDDALARSTWPRMMEFVRFFFPHRDGNGDGLIEQGATFHHEQKSPGEIIQEAMDESGYDDLPIYSAGFGEGRRALLTPGVGFDWKSRCLKVTAVCQNSLYIAACRAMAVLGKQLGESTDVDWLLAEADRVALRMREWLFCDAKQMFIDRHWDGSFSKAKTFTRFLPLLADLNKDSEREILRSMLLNSGEFWGENLLPTVSRDDPAYCDGLDERGNYWRGNCWPPTTYMGYLAIKQAGWDDVAAEYGQRAMGQFMQYWREHTHFYENYPPEGAVDPEFLYLSPWGGRESHYVWAAMQPLCALEEIFGLELDGKLRFGNPHLLERCHWNGFIYRGRRVQAEAGPLRTSVAVDGPWTLACEPGVSIRRFSHDGGQFDFTVHTSSEVRVTFSGPGIPERSRINGEWTACERIGNAVSFRLPPGIQVVHLEAISSS